MRRLVILAVLYGVMQFVLVLGSREAGAPVLMLLGFLILAAYSVGELAKSVGLPKIVGYLAAGVIFGPSGLSYVSVRALTELAPVSELAIALIAFLAGSELEWKELRARWDTVSKVMLTELAVSFLAVASVFAILHEQLDFLAGAPWAHVAAFSVLFASVAIVHSPVVTMAVLSETGARGPVARTSLSVVLLADVAVVITFTAALALTRMMVPPASGAPFAFSLVAWEIAGAVLVGAIFGAAVAAYLRFIRRELLIFAILVALLGAEVSRIAHVETLLMLLVAGFVAQNYGGEHGVEFRHSMERAAAPIFVVFFALAGAKIIPEAITSLWMIALPIAVVRILAIRLGTQLGARWAKAESKVEKHVWYGLVSQAGVALGLATVAAQVYPDLGSELRLLFIAMIAINEIAGPALFRFGLSRAGEVVESEAGSRKSDH